jgi:dienelactone hydrolase
MHVADVEYFHGDLRLVGQIAVDDELEGERPAVLVSHDARGLSDHPKNVARKLAQLGYVAFALDYYGNGEELDPEQVGPRFTELSSDPLLARSIGNAGFEVLVGNEFADPAKVATIGYCFGGTLVLEMARGGTDVVATVGFHSGLSTSRPNDAKGIKGKVLVNIGADDPIVPPDQRLAFEEEMRKGGVDWQMHLHGGAVHSFTDPAADGSNPAIKYDRRADERSWKAMLDLFAEVF